MAAAKLTSSEFSQLKEVLNMVELKDPEPPLKKEKQLLALEDKKPDSEEEALEEDTPLKKAEEVSLDSSGFPTMFGTPDKASKGKGNSAVTSLFWHCTEIVLQSWTQQLQAYFGTVPWLFCAFTTHTWTGLHKQKQQLPTSRYRTMRVLQYQVQEL